VLKNMCKRIQIIFVLQKKRNVETFYLKL